jgi:hypothetical protein
MVHEKPERCEQAGTKKRSMQRDAGDDGNSRSRVGEDDIEKEERRRRKKERRRQEKRKEYFASFGLDENGEKMDNFSILKYPVREWKINIRAAVDPIALNPIVTLIAVVCLFSIICWSSGTLCLRSEDCLATFLTPCDALSLLEKWIRRAHSTHCWRVKLESSSHLRG